MLRPAAALETMLEVEVIARTAERDYVNAVYGYQMGVVLPEEAVGERLR